MLQSKKNKEDTSCLQPEAQQLDKKEEKKNITPDSILPVIPAETITEESPLYCQLHLGLLCEPVMNTSCGHTYCASCIQAWKAQQKTTCPVCRCELTTFIPNLTVKQLLGELRIHCRYGCKTVRGSNSEEDEFVEDVEGCPEYVIMQNRFTHEKDCQYASVPCPLGFPCSGIRRMNADKHKALCPFSLVTQTEDIVKLNVGGTLFTTSKTTLCKYESKLKYMVENEDIYQALPRDEQGAIFLDHDPAVFSTLLQFLRGHVVELRLKQQNLALYGLFGQPEHEASASCSQPSISCDGFYRSDEYSGMLLWFISSTSCHFVTAAPQKQRYSCEVAWNENDGYVDVASLPPGLTSLYTSLGMKKVISVKGEGKGLWGHNNLLLYCRPKLALNPKITALYQFEPFASLPPTGQLIFLMYTHKQQYTTIVQVSCLNAKSRGRVHSWIVESDSVHKPVLQKYGLQHCEEIHVILGQSVALLGFNSPDLSHAIPCSYTKKVEERDDV